MELHALIVFFINMSMLVKFYLNLNFLAGDKSDEAAMLT